jgi:aspartate-semialdehyde dehydrogenase
MGQPGVDELFQQTVNALNLQSIPKEVFDRQLAFNLYPAPGAGTVEAWAGAQLRSILSAPLPVALSMTQGTIFHGHSFSIFILADGNITAAELRQSLTGREGLALGEDDVSTLDAAGKDEVQIGRVAADPQVPGGFWIWAVADNLRRSSALNAVLIAEAMIAGAGVVN